MTDGINTKTGMYADSAGFDKKADADAKAYVNIRDDGSMDTNFDWGQLGQDRINGFLNMMEPLAQRREEIVALLSSARDSGDGALVQKLEGMLGKIDAKFQEIKDFVQSNNARINSGETLGSVLANDSMFSGTIDDMMAEFEVGFRQFDYDSMSEAITSAAEKLGISGDEFAAQVGMGETQFEPPPTGANDSASSGDSVDGSGDVEWASKMMTNPDEAIAQFEKDPEGFFSKLKELDAADRQAVIMTLQNEMQANNQLQSTLSNFLKAMHDTDKAIIGNLRV